MGCEAGVWRKRGHLRGARRDGDSAAGRSVAAPHSARFHSRIHCHRSAPGSGCGNAWRSDRCPRAAAPFPGQHWRDQTPWPLQGWRKSLNKWNRRRSLCFPLHRRDPIRLERTRIRKISRIGNPHLGRGVRASPGFCRDCSAHPVERVRKMGTALGSGRAGVGGDSTCLAVACHRPSLCFRSPRRHVGCLRSRDSGLCDSWRHRRDSFQGCRSTDCFDSRCPLHTCYKPEFAHAPAFYSSGLLSRGGRLAKEAHPPLLRSVWTIPRWPGHYHRSGLRFLYVLYGSIRRNDSRAWWLVDAGPFRRALFG